MVLHHLPAKEKKIKHLMLHRRSKISHFLYRCSHLWLLDLQVLPILNGEVDVLQHYVDTLLICPVEGQKPYHAVVIYLGNKAKYVYVGLKKIQQ